MRHMLRTPDNVSDAITALAESLNATGEPVFLAIVAEPGAGPSNCFGCIRDKVEREGGVIRFGWAIWEWPRVFVEAEHHAVYEPPEGPPCADITPPANPEIRRRLFVPDDSAIYDFENEGIRRDNVRLALSNDPEIEAFFLAAELRTRLENSIPGVGAVVVDKETARALALANARMARIQEQLALRYTGQNERCFCGSNIKFKRCHGQRMVR